MISFLMATLFDHIPLKGVNVFSAFQPNSVTSSRQPVGNAANSAPYTGGRLRSASRFQRHFLPTSVRGLTLLRTAINSTWPILSFWPGWTALALRPKLFPRATSRQQPTKRRCCGLTSEAANWWSVSERLLSESGTTPPRWMWTIFHSRPTRAIRLLYYATAKVKANP